MLTESAGRRGRRRAAGIYGVVVTAAILTAAGSQLSTAALTVAVVVTLLVYWVAEEYAELLGEHVVDGKLPGRRQVRAELLATWPMVSASFGPLLVALLARLAGTSAVAAANAGLAAAVVLLVWHAWSAGRAARLGGWPLVALTSVGALLGIVMILLKNVVLVHLH
ncbi:hypothetical protein GCM10017788_40520 [Amycolatopsis acidiphila]|uniref:Uncharacterized protein n=1 Tax=Amycolatopsis acidiphila TaxID=715473 RepID=A0A558APC2_9PSEU|nr:hypothetical protein FNH06_00085 [Amycolatopsis acidiphila]GHG75505.1 hypothetical protein GCM10017788_40520 [Amycolatopsis acidiphila]